MESTVVIEYEGRQLVIPMRLLADALVEAGGGNLSTTWRRGDGSLLTLKAEITQAAPTSVGSYGPPDRA